jgi:iron complex outermembrane receptor protein
MRAFRGIVLAGASLLSMSSSAFGQQVAGNDATAETQSPTVDYKDIVVTGTLIRGIAPGGSQTIAVDAEKIAAIGAVNTSDLVASIPQAGNFLGFVGIRGTNTTFITVNRPSLRYLGNNSSSTNSTLVLVDGHRLPGMGIRQSTMDLDAISPNAVERVDVVTDGGSSTYGSDAVGGVINFITRSRFDGVELKGSYGLADDYNQYNASIIAGRTFGNVAAYVAYDYSHHDGFLGGDRDYSQSRDWINDVPSDVACQVGNLRATVAGVTTTYALPGRTAGLGNRCDNTELVSLYPEETKHSVLGSITIDTGGPVSFAVKAYYVHRENLSNGGPLLANAGVTLRNTSPYFVPLPGAPTSELAFFNLASLYGNSSRAASSLESYGVTPSIKWEIGGGWQANAIFNYGVGKADFLGEALNAAVITAAATANAFDPINLANPVNATALASARDWFTFGRGRHDMINARAIADGPLFELPGGAVRAAIGVEYLKETYEGLTGTNTAVLVASLPNREARRNVKSVFGELNVPVLGEGSGIGDLSVALSGRYDDYSDFGGTFNPKVGVNFKPIDGLKIRGNWGTAFQAPGISLLAEASVPNFALLAIATRPFTNPALPATAQRTNILAYNGPISPLQPQTAKTWSAGFDIEPSALPGFSAGLTYYSVHFKDVIGQPTISSPRFYTDFPNGYVTFDKGDAALLAYFNELNAQGSTNGAQTLATLGGTMTSVYGILDARTKNLSSVKTTGLDYYIRMRHETGFGDIYGDISGNYVLTFDQQASAGAATFSTLETDTTRLRVATTLGTNVGNLRAQVVWNHSQGYDIIPTAANLRQDHVGSYNVFNLFFQYKASGESPIGKDLTFTLNVDNLFDQDPPLLRGSTATFFGFANGFTIGRLVRFGVAKKF